MIRRNVNIKVRSPFRCCDPRDRMHLSKRASKRIPYNARMLYIAGTP